MPVATSGSKLLAIDSDMNEETIEALVVVRTYPVPSSQSIESSCTAGITREGQWVRLYPVPHRLLDVGKRFRKWQWVSVRVRAATRDPRLESRRIDEDSIQILPERLSTGHQWADRRRIVMPLKAQSMCWLQAERDREQHPTLGIIKPREIQGFRIVPEENPEWSEAELAKLRQQSMFYQSPAHELEKIPVKFYFRYLCEDTGCGSHNMMCPDWELAELYRNLRPNWESGLRKKVQWMIEERDLHFFVGTLSDHPGNWIIVGLWYPPRDQQGVLV